VWTLGDTANEHVKVDTTGVSLKDGSTVYGQFAATTAIGSTSTEHVEVTSTSVKLKDGTTTYTDLTAGTLILGDSANEHVKVSTSGVEIYDGTSLLANYGASTTLYDSAGADRLVLSTTGVTVGNVTDGEYLTIDSTNGITMYAGGALYAQLANTGELYLGSATGGQVRVSGAGGTQIWTGSDLIASYGSSIVLYDTGAIPRLQLDTSGIIIGDMTKGNTSITDTSIELKSGFTTHLELTNAGTFWAGDTSTTERIEWDTTNG